MGQYEIPSKLNTIPGMFSQRLVTCKYIPLKPTVPALPGYV